MALSKGVYIVAAKRTPFGSFGGALTKFSATDLGVHAATAALAAGKVDPALVQATIFGNVAQSSSDAPYMARHVGLKAGAPIEATALNVNRLCGSGFQVCGDKPWARSSLCGRRSSARLNQLLRHLRRNPRHSL